MNQRLIPCSKHLLYYLKSHKSRNTNSLLTSCCVPWKTQPYMSGKYCSRCPWLFLWPGLHVSSFFFKEKGQYLIAVGGKIWQSELQKPFSIIFHKSYKFRIQIKAWWNTIPCNKQRFPRNQRRIGEYHCGCQ